MQTKMDTVLRTGLWNVVLARPGERFETATGRFLAPEREVTAHFFIAEHAGREGFHELGHHWGWMPLDVIAERAARGAGWLPHYSSKEMLVTGEDFAAVTHWALGDPSGTGPFGRKGDVIREGEVRFVDYGDGRRFNAILRAHIARAEALADAGVPQDDAAVYEAFASDVVDVIDRHGSFVQGHHWDEAAEIIVEVVSR